MPPTIIDLTGSDSDDQSEISWEGYRRNINMSESHLAALEIEGVVCTGFNSSSIPTKRKFRDIANDSDDSLESDQSPAAARPKSASSNITRSRNKKGTSKCRNRHPGPPPKTQAEIQREIEREEEEDYIAALSAVDLNYEPNWTNPSYPQRLQLDVDPREPVESKLAVSHAVKTAEHIISERVYRRISNLPKDHFDWRPLRNNREHKPLYLFEGMPISRSKASVSQAAYMSGNTVTSGHTHRTPGRPSLDRMLPQAIIHQAPGDTNTIVQTNEIIVIASAVLDGDLNDIPGPYNKEGSLFASFQSNGHVLNDHSGGGDAYDEEPKHHFTVNDVALDPLRPARFASAGRDKQVLIWDWDPMGEDDPHPWKVTVEVACKDNPECIKYKPGSSLLAIQCNNGSVYLVTEDNRLPRCFSVAPTERRHVTADMIWGIGRSDKLLFASSACLEGESGFHKAYDVTNNKTVIEFDADERACSTLALDPLGERLYIATEGPGRVPTYTLRQYDVRNGGSSKAAAQQVKLKPFAGSPDRAGTEINSLSLSPDGIYIAVGRSDNWVDVYDSRMLQRRELHSFAHEGGGPDTYGVVKTQWVDGYPFGFGLVSGGVDGCVRLWDTKLASSDPVNGKILARGDYDVATFSLGDIFKGEAPIILGERSGKVTLYGFSSTSDTS